MTILPNVIHSHIGSNRWVKPGPLDQKFPVLVKTREFDAVTAITPDTTVTTVTTVITDSANGDEGVIEQVGVGHPPSRQNGRGEPAGDAMTVVTVSPQVRPTIGDQTWERVP